MEEHGSHVCMAQRHGAGFGLPRDAGRRPALRAVRLAWRRVVGAGFALPRDRGQRRRCGFRAPARYRSETPAGRTGRRSAVARHPALRGTRREENHPDGWGLRRRGPAGRCAGPHRENWPEVGVPLRPAPSGPVGFTRGAAFSQQGWCGTHVGGAPRHRRGFRAPARCRSETGAPCRRDSARLAMRGFAAVRLAGGGVVGAGFALPRDRGQRCRGGFRAPARCRSETGAPGATVGRHSGQAPPFRSARPASARVRRIRANS